MTSEDEDAFTQLVYTRTSKAPALAVACKCGNSESFLDEATDTCKPCPKNSYAAHPSDGSCETRCMCRPEYYEFPLPKCEGEGECYQLVLKAAPSSDTKKQSADVYSQAQKDTGFGCKKCPRGETRNVYHDDIFNMTFNCRRWFVRLGRKYAIRQEGS